MADDDAMALVQLGEVLCGIDVPPEDRDGVAMHLANSLRLADMIGDGAAENAPVFRP